MFTSEEREEIREDLVEMGKLDRRILSAALVGSSSGTPDRWSDIDLTFGVSENADLSEVISDWTNQLDSKFSAVPLFDLPYGESLYRVFLFPHALQVDLSFTPQKAFGSFGPRFKLLWGTLVERSREPPESPEYLFGMAAHHLVRARICIERKTFWQAEYWISAARDSTLAIQCLNAGLSTNQARGVDELPEQITDAFEQTLIGSLDRESLSIALNKSVELLIGMQVQNPNRSRIDSNLKELLILD